MPELPEVETIRRQLDKVLVGQRIKGLSAFAKGYGETMQGIIGKKIVAVKRKAKMIIIELSKGESLLIHLKMTGQLIYNGKENKYTRAIFELDKGKLYFNDLRKFGWIKLVTNKELKQQLVKLPPDVVDKKFTKKYLEKVLKSSGRAIKLVLLDQTKMGGIGNIYANEILFCGGTDPRIPANRVKNINELHQCIQKIINQGIKYGGSTASDEHFVNARGEPGMYQQHFLVYEQEGKKCSRCKGEIIKIKLGGRGTYYCPACQK